MFQLRALFFSIKIKCSFYLGAKSSFEKLIVVYEGLSESTIAKKCIRIIQFERAQRRQWHMEVYVG